ncbi:DMT family transporter [Pseudodesulfovibrio sp. zrk46]|uniref:DMT family transporter n=1 Tax=Pseudodesulfovibrio sp. zrk46 TaxID=2725288 RepID=UPI001449DB9F|nr:DMT family transporter [Pseudodesulfovibrio sp. zrk46]QJB55716.1 DMT family transporter [Pseudodesulfovibrio sp. zrk46]
MKNVSFVGGLCALLATMIWSGNFIVARGLGDVIPPFTLACLRWSTGTVAIMPFAAPLIWRDRALLMKHWKHLFVSSVLGVTVFNTLIYIAAHTTSAMNMTLIATTTPVFVIILSRIFLGETITANRAIGLVVAVAGIVTLVTRGNLDVLMGLDFRVGDLWMLLAGFIWAVYSIIIRKKPKEINQFAYLGVTFLAGVLPLIPAAAIELSVAPPLNITPTVIGSVLYIGIGASLISYMLWTKAVTSIGPVIPSLIYYSLPAFCGMEAYLFLNEPVTMIHGVAFLLIVGGIVFATHPKFQKKA